MFVTWYFLFLRFGLYGDPFDVNIFDIDLATLIEYSLRRHHSNTSLSTSSNPTNIPQSSRSNGMNDNCYDPRIHSRYGPTGPPAIPTDPEALFSFCNIQYALSKLLPNSLSSSNVYLKPIPDLFEVTPLNYTIHSSSDGTRLESVDMTHLLTLRSYEIASWPASSTVALTAGSHYPYNAVTSSSIPPPPVPPSISTFNSSATIPLSYPATSINPYYDSFYMLPSSTTNPTGTTTAAHNDIYFSGSSVTTVDNQMNNNPTASPWLPHLASKFKDKQSLQKEKLKLIAKKNKAATAQSSMLKKNSALLNDLIHSSSTTIPNQPKCSSVNNNYSDDKTREQQSTTIDDIVTQISNNFLHEHCLPLYQFIIDRLFSGSRSYFVLDFGQQVTFTDILIPSYQELASLSLDFWSLGEHIDCQRLFSSTHISTQPLFLHDLQPTIVARYIRITLIGQTNIPVSSIRLPVGYFFGYSYIFNDDNDNINNNNYEKYKNIIKLIEGNYESLLSTYALCRQKLSTVLSSTSEIEKNFIENIYQECIQLQIQVNQASRQIKQCRHLLKMDTFQINHQQPTSDYLKLLADLLTNELTSLSGLMQRRTR